MSLDKNNRQAIIYGLMAVLLWSTVATAFKITLRYYTPLQMVFLASVVSVLCLLSIVVWQKKLPLLLPALRTSPALFLVSGLINPVVYYWVLFAAYDLLPASQAQPLNYSWAITLSILAVFFLKQRFTLQDTLACVLAYAGVIVIATRGDVLAMQVESPLGVGLALASTLLWSIYWIINTRNSTDPVIGLLLSFFLSLPFSLVLCLVVDGVPDHSFSSVLAVSYVGLFEMGVAFLLWLMAMKLTSNTAQLSNLIFISPFLSLVLLALIIGEQIHVSSVFGLLMIVAGLLLQHLRLGRDKNKPDLIDKPGL